MKRPAASLKKPASKQEEQEAEPEEPEHVPLTAQAVKDHNKFCEEAQGMSVGQFEKALSCLDGAASQRLWKAFAKSRKSSGEQEKYPEATTSAKDGSLAKKRKLLFGWVCDGKETGEHYKSMVETVSLKKSEGVTSTWLTKNQALQHWGKEELQERVASGSIVARKDPADSKYWQFKANTEESKVFVNREKAVSWAKKGKSNNKELSKLLQTQGLEKLTEKDFTAPTDSEEDSDGLPAGLAEALGNKSEKSTKEKKEKKENKKDKWEEISQVCEDESQSQLQSRLMSFKVELIKDLAVLDGYTHEKGLAKSLLKEAAQEQKRGQAVVSLLAKLHKSKAKKKEAKPALQTALTTLRALKAKKLQVAKALKE